MGEPIDPRDRNRDGRLSAAERAFNYVHHPWLLHRRDAGPVKVADQLPAASRFDSRLLDAVTRFNSRVAVGVTRAVGTMWCAYAFAAMDLISLPTAIDQGAAAVVTWVAQTFFQLVLLSIIMVGQNIQGVAADARSEQTFKDVGALLHQHEQMQEHLKVIETKVTGNG